MAGGFDAPLAFHFRPAQGWMNDPNGLIERDGVHHLFFQHNPEAPTFGRICWGHATSTDLLTWTERPLALVPGDDGNYDEDGCWSGCAVELEDGRVAVLYSANRRTRQLPALAISAEAELQVWKKHSANPVVSTWPPVPGLTDLRDHSVVQEFGARRQVLAGGRDSILTGARGADVPAAADGGGEACSSATPRSPPTCRPGPSTACCWTDMRPICPARSGNARTFAFHGVAHGEAVVIMSWYTRDAAWPGGFRSDVLWLTGPYAAGHFTPQHYGRLDLGDRFYAPQSYTTANGRRLMFGWLRTRLDPATVGSTTVGAGSLPGRLLVHSGRLHQEPAAEIDLLPWATVGQLTPTSAVLDLEVASTTLEVAIHCGDPGDLTGVVVELTDLSGHTLSVALLAFAQKSSWRRADGGWAADEVVTRDVRMLVDGGIVETFADDGRAAATSDLALGAVRRVALTGQLMLGTVVQVRAV